MAKPAAKAVKPVPAAPATTDEPKGKGGGKNKLLVLLLGTILVAAAGAGGWYYFVASAAHSTQETRVQPGKPPVFVNLEPFTVNLQQESGADQYLQAVAVLRVIDDKASETLKQYMPELRHRTLMLLSSKKASEIATPDGREKLALEMRATVNQLIAAATGKTPRVAVAAIRTSPAAIPAPPAAAPVAKPLDGGAIPQPVIDHAADEPVQSVLFTSFIIQ